MAMSTIELLMKLQYEFPLNRRPFDEISKILDMDTGQLLNIVKNLRERRIIRRLGAVLNYRARKLEAALVGLQVPDPHVEDIAEFINNLGGVSHNFLREHKYNIWFVIKRRTLNDIVNIVRELVNRYRVKNYVILRSVKTYRLDVRFNLYRGISEAKRLREADSVPTLEEVTKLPIEILKELKDVPIVENPFDEICGKYGIDVEQFLYEIRRLIELNVLRDFYAVLNQDLVNFKVNAMVIVKTSNIEKILSIREPTHIVLREFVDGTERFGQGLYLMVHAVSRDIVIRFLKEKLRDFEHLVIYSTRNLLPEMPHDVEYMPTP